MSEIINVDKAFSLEHLKVKEKKAIEILENCEGNSFKEKLENLSKIAENFGEINEFSKDYAKKYKSNLVSVRTAITRVGKSVRDIFTAESRKEKVTEIKLLEIIKKGEISLKEKIEEYERKKEIESRRPLLPVLRKMLEEIEIHDLEDDYILAFSEKDFNNFYAEKRQEFFQKKEDERLQKEREEKLKKEAIEKFKQEEEKKKIEKENQEKLEKEKAEKNKAVLNWKKENNFNEKTDFIKIENNKATIWRKISELNF